MRLSIEREPGTSFLGSTKVKAVLSIGSKVVVEQDTLAGSGGPADSAVDGTAHLVLQTGIQVVAGLEG